MQNYEKYQYDIRFFLEININSASRGLAENGSETRKSKTYYRISFSKA